MAQIQIENNGTFSSQSKIPVMKKVNKKQNAKSSIERSSRLEQIQQNFQQKLVKEKEKKMIQLYEDNQQRTINKVIRKSGKGLVRDFFKERRALEKKHQGIQDGLVPPIDVHFRQKKQQIMSEVDVGEGKQSTGQVPIQQKLLQKHSAGRDRSHPLAPIERNNMKEQNSSLSLVSTNQKSKLQQPQVKRYSGSGIPSYQNIRHNNNKTTELKNVPINYDDDFEDCDDGDQNENELCNGNESSDEDENEEPIIKSHLLTQKISRLKQQKLEYEKNTIDEQDISQIKEVKKDQRATSPYASGYKSKEKKDRNQQSSPFASKFLDDKLPQTSQFSEVENTAANSSVIISHESTSPFTSEFYDDRESPRIFDYTEEEKIPQPTPDGLVSCSICGRHFNMDRIQVHAVVCEKTSKKKRKVFDPVKMRTQGTEMEQYRRKLSKKPEVETRQSNWRKKHENFIESIRLARVTQRHLASGGKLSDLPPPPPSENPDYIQCTHCQRRFNAEAAERHIPRCQNIGTKPFVKKDTAKFKHR